MPRQLALLLCTTFVLFLLRLERRESAGVSAAAVDSHPLDAGDRQQTAGHLVWTVAARKRVAGSTGCADWPERRGHRGAGPPPVRLGRRAAPAWMAGGAAGLHVSQHALVRHHAHRPSALGARGDRRVMALVVMSEPTPRQALESLLRRSAYVLLPFSLLLIKYYPALGVDYGRWSGEPDVDRGHASQEHAGSPLPRQRVLPALGAVSALARPGASERAEAGGGRRLRSPIALYLLKGAENAYSATSIGTFAVGIATSSVLDMATGTATFGPGYCADDTRRLLDRFRDCGAFPGRRESGRPQLNAWPG